MRIESVEAFPLRFPRDYAGALGSGGSPAQLKGEGEYRWASTYPCLYSTLIETALVRVRLDDGTEGWGEAQAPIAPEVPCAIVERILRVAVMGQEFCPSRQGIAELWERMYSTMRVRGQTGGFMLDAISGVDLALWDLAGQCTGQSISVLAGGTRSRVSAYLSGVPGGRWDEAQRWRNTGVAAIKVYYRSTLNELLADLGRAEGIFGRAALAVDALWRLDPFTARELCRRLNGIMFLECPFPPEEAEWHIDLARSTDVPLAIGESYRTRYELRRLLECDAVRFLQPDLGRSGLTEGMRIADLARSHGVKIVPHVSIAQAPQLAAAIHFAAAQSEASLLEFNPTILDAANQFLASPLEVRDGCYLVPSGPGLGVRFSASAPWIQEGRDSNNP
ncbi:MAG: mandelate racemase/muconate lactonizing enzyme family protein [Terriglobia bacterium]|jgi:galactonate dehydratase